ncbi:ABC transporter ATP-binding protein [Gloeobacter violaceus]|uniref:HlyB/MsbA family ABC transporter n=1 Tax=Gloeobacter violaceus (strain ATCC 29082 / PCC 7421) TaxID=251221 RepID=Q7NF54_GLOVI|nr:ABC transporter ATP-binding protein [Gloeobacter violaceus]BAC91613.1 HlyB/MsbA family ABC transporter [Gloeobacter violaceus PCC 7421]
MASSSLSQLYSYLKPHRGNLLLGVFTLLITNALGVVIPWLLAEAIDDLGRKLTSGGLLYYTLLILGLATVMGLIRVWSRVLLFSIGRRVEFDLKGRIFSHLLRMSPAYFAQNPVGDLINRATSDVENVRRLLGFALLSIINTFFAYTLTLPVMLGLDWTLTLQCLAVYPLMFLAVWLFSDRLRSEQIAVQRGLDGLSSLIQEDINGISLIKVYAQEENERRAFDQKNGQLLKANLSLALSRNLIFPLLGGLASGSLLVLLWFGGPRLAEGSLTIGAFAALAIYIERLVFPTALLGFTITSYQRGQVSIERIERILSVAPSIVERSDAVSPEPVRGAIDVKALTYFFEDSDRPALDGVNFHVEPGESVAIVGAIGSGKSTLANALPRLLEIAPGQVFLDSVDVTHLRFDSLRTAIAYVPQESFLFSATVEENIRYGRPDASEQAVVAAARQARIHDEISDFPRGYRTLVGERGITLSGGQRQRVALARAFLMDAPVLVLDDSLASVDNQTAEEILQHLARQKRTLLLITHRLSAAAACDRVLVMERGQIAESGSHTELLRRGGLYRQLWEQQELEKALS